MNPLDALAVGLAAFYGAYVVARTSGPAGVFARLRAAPYVGEAASCFYCASLYTGALAYALLIVWAPGLYVLAAAGLAAFLYRYTGAGSL